MGNLKNHDLISIIVPVYNVEKYIERCIKSILNQSYKELEIIFIDDSSTDRSAEIIKKYAAIDSRIIYEKTNGGVSIARNAGIQIAKGDYISFIDSDDFVESNFIEELYNGCILQNAEISYCDAYFNFQGKKNDIIKFTEKSTWLFENVCVWNKMYKKEVFDKNDISFFEGIWYEDLEILPRLMFSVKKSVYINKPLYYYCQNENSITRTFSRKILDIEVVLNNLKRFFEDNQSKYYKKDLVFIYNYICVYHGFCGTIYRMMCSDIFTNKEIKEYYKKTNGIIKENRYSLKILYELPIKYKVFNLILYTWNIKWIRNLVKGKCE